MALATINSDSIKLFEDYVNENKNLLEGTVYENLIANNLKFKLKPGHKVLILSLPEALENNEVKKKQYFNIGGTIESRKFHSVSRKKNNKFRRQAFV